MAAATNRIGAATAAKMICADGRPVEKPSHAGRQPISTTATTSAKGRSRCSKSGAIQAQLSGIRVSATRVEVVMEFEVYYDYTCPFVYRASLLLAGVAGERALDVRWRYFSLTQVNSKDEGWTVWDAPAGERVRGRLAFMAAEAARRQDRFEPFHATLLRARHEGRINIDEVEAIEQVAEDSGLELGRFRRDIDDPAILVALARDHRHAVGAHGVFGTPTFVFPNGASAYIRLAEAPTGSDALQVFDRLIAVASDEPRILEIKRPTKPSPD